MRRAPATSTPPATRRQRHHRQRRQQHADRPGRQRHAHRRRGRGQFVFARGTSAAAGKRDLITDFMPGTDQIDLTGMDADTGTRGRTRSAFWARRRSTARRRAAHGLRQCARRDGAGRRHQRRQGCRLRDRSDRQQDAGTADFTAGSLLIPLNLAGAGSDTLTGGELDDTLRGLAATTR